MNFSDQHTCPPVFLSPCADYSPETVNESLDRLLEASGGLDWVTEGMTVGIKANLVSAMRPDECATTHPALLTALSERLIRRGARVIIGDSPGGLYTPAFVGHIYDVTGIHEAESVGAELNNDYGQTDTAYPEARVLRSFVYTSWLDSCDALIDFCKLKSHGMMGMSAAAKNLFGVIPGTMKPEYHFRFPAMSDFAHMLVDINDYFADKVRLCLVDAVDGMEGNGPTKGTPRHIGVLLASISPHAADAVAARLIHLTAEEVPTLIAARERHLIPDSLSEVPLTVVTKDGIRTNADAESFAVADFQSVAVRQSHLFNSKGKLVGNLLQKLLSSRPQLHEKACVGCGKCASICPAHAITIRNKKAVIDRTKCIRCFCCQEFCPTGAMKVHRTPIARLLVRNTKR